jgi:glucose/arabinose dehydrogenase
MVWSAMQAAARPSDEESMIAVNVLRGNWVIALTALGLAAATTSWAQKLPLHSIRLPSGFAIEVFAENVPNARSLALGKDGTVFVGTRSDKVYAIKSQDGKSAQVFTIASGLNMPNGVAFRDGALYVAEVSRVWRFDDIEARLSKPPHPVLVSDRFPGERHHGWKFIAFGPDGWLYVPVGAPCNICEPDPSRYANIMRMKPDGSSLQVFARGVRNSVGFDWDPTTGELWFTDNGRDMLGDDIPSCELNHAPKPGMHFGFPYCHQGDLPDPEYGAKHACSEFTPPALKLGPHVAPLGMRFYTGSMFPSDYRNSIILAEHGSWNRSHKIGYRLVRVVVKDNRVERQDVFAEGWLQGEQNWGRPVDVLVMPDGALLVSDDQAGVVYRITYRNKTS